jgi:CRP/FNR family transcriptional regulator
MSAREYTTIARRFLRAHPFASRQVQPTAAIIGRCTPRTLATGALLCTAGDPGDELFWLLSGSVRVLHASGDELFLIEAPALIGHMALVDGSRRSATCVAATPAQLAVMDRALYHRTITDISPEGVALRRILLSSLSHQLNTTTSMLNELLTAHAEPLSNEDTEEVVIQIAGALHGWNLDFTGVDEIEHIEDSHR